MGKDKEVKISLHMDKEYLANKDYDMRAYALSGLAGEWDPIEKKKFWKSATTLKQALMNTCHLSKYRAGKVLNTFLELGFIFKKNGLLYIDDVTGNYLQLTPSTINYCLTALSDNAFKVYCYLKGIWAYRESKQFRFQENYFFSCRELVKMMGYSPTNQKNIVMVTQILMTLEKIGLIEYNHESVYRTANGQLHGQYHELLEVYDIPVPNIQIVKEIKDGTNKDIYDWDSMPLDAWGDESRMLEYKADG